MKATEAKNWCVMVLMHSSYTPFGSIHIPNDILKVEFYDDMENALDVFRGWRVLHANSKTFEVRMYEIDRSIRA